MKERLSLLDVCKLPDVQIHSKTAFFKSLINQQSPQTIEMKDQIVNLSYTVKTIGVQGEQVGISSKRIPLKFKKKQDKPQNHFQQPRNYLPHQSFYANALIPIRKQKQSSFFKRTDLQIMSVRNTIQIQTDPSYETHKFKIRSKSMSQMRTNSLNRLKPNRDQNSEFGKIQGIARINSAIKKKSFSGMLKECTLLNNQTESINPLMHSENPLLKKIKRIKQIYPDICEERRYSSSRPKSKFSSSSNLLRIYRQQN